MKTKRALIYLALAVVAAGVIFVIEQPDRPRVNDTAMGYFEANFDSVLVASVWMEQLSFGAELKRDGDSWMVSERVTPAKKDLLAKEGKEIPESKWQEADRSRIMNALGVFGAIENGALVSDNPDKKSLYQVDATGLSVRAFDKEGKTLLDVVIGKNGPDFNSTYIRRANENKVYLVHQAILGIFSPNADDWKKQK